MNRLFIFPWGGISLFLWLTGCSSHQVKLPELPQDPHIQVYFNHNQTQGKKYWEFYRNIERTGDDLETIVIEEINRANERIDIAVQEFNLSRLASAIVQKQKEGVKVRVIIENQYNLPLNELRANNGLAILKQNNVPVIDDTEDGSKGSGLMHHKFILIDGQKVITGSANLTLSGIHGDFDNLETRGNANHLVVINNSDLAQIFTREFNYLWGDGVGGSKDSVFGLKKPVHAPETIVMDNSTVVVKFSPNSTSMAWETTTNGLINQTIDHSQSSVDLALFVFSEQKIADTMQRKYSQGVQVRTLIDRNFAYRYYSEGLDLLGVALFDRQCRYEKDNNPWTKPIKNVGIPNLPRGDKLHHKFAVIDNYIVITGSHNWSHSANHLNDETLLIIYNPVVAKHFQREFDYLYADAELGITTNLEERIQQKQQDCPEG